jgi:Ca2+-binding EF-hand superfamily protein
MGAGASAVINDMRDESIDGAKRLFKDKEKLKKLWDRIDFNNNQMVSLAEIDKMVVELADSPGEDQAIWASFDNKPALMRAYKRTTLKDGDGDSWVERREFVPLLRNLFFFNKLWRIFDDFDVEDDRRINAWEFRAGLGSLGFNMSERAASMEFATIDINDGGQILFDEFCGYCITKAGFDDKNLEREAVSEELQAQKAELSEKVITFYERWNPEKLQVKDFVEKTVDEIIAEPQQQEVDSDTDEPVVKKKKRKKKINHTKEDYMDIVHETQSQGFKQVEITPTMTELHDEMTETIRLNEERLYEEAHVSALDGGPSSLFS